MRSAMAKYDGTIAIETPRCRLSPKETMGHWGWAGWDGRISAARYARVTSGRSNDGRVTTAPRWWRDGPPPAAHRVPSRHAGKHPAARAVGTRRQCGLRLHWTGARPVQKSSSPFKRCKNCSMGATARVWDCPRQNDEIGAAKSIYRHQPMGSPDPSHGSLRAAELGGHG